MKYRTRPRNVDAAQWNPDRPGDLIGMLANHNISWIQDGRGDMCVDPDGDAHGVDSTDWVVIDGDEIEAFSDARFRDRFEARNLRGGVRNTVSGNVGGTVIQTGGDYHGNLRF